MLVGIGALARSSLKKPRHLRTDLIFLTCVGINRLVAAVFLISLGTGRLIGEDGAPGSREKEIYLRINNLFFYKQSSAKRQLVLTCVGQFIRTAFWASSEFVKGLGFPFVLIGLIGVQTAFEPCQMPSSSSIVPSLSSSSFIGKYPPASWDLGL